LHTLSFSESLKDFFKLGFSLYLEKGFVIILSKEDEGIENVVVFYNTIATDSWIFSGNDNYFSGIIFFLVLT